MLDPSLDSSHLPSSQPNMASNVEKINVEKINVEKINVAQSNVAQSNIEQLDVEQLDMETRIREEQLRQAHHSFNVSLVVMLTSAILGFASVGLLLHGKTNAAAATASTSVISIICGGSLKFSREANQRLKR
jgi:hypothetical protein